MDKIFLGDYMFYRYDFRKINNKDTLYLYLSSSTEEANEFKNDNDENIENKIKRFIKQNNINYDEGPVYIISNGIIIKSVDIKNKDVEIKEIKNKKTNIYSNNEFIVNVRFSNNNVKRITLKNYLISAVLTNISYDCDKELLKSIIVLYRTYIYEKMAKDGFINNNDEFIEYKSISYFKLLWFYNFNHLINNIEQAIDETDTTFITYNNLYIKPYIHNTNNGTTDSLPSVGYLQKVNSLWDLASPLYLSITKYKVEEVLNMLSIDKDELNNLSILSLTEAGCIDRIKLGKKVFTGESFMNKLHLPSKDMTILIDEDIVTFINRGYGNNLGLSLEGGKTLSKSGCNYLQILNYYFPKCRIKKYI